MSVSATKMIKKTRNLIPAKYKN